MNPVPLPGLRRRLKDLVGCTFGHSVALHDPPTMRTYCVYIAASLQKTLYVGVTSDLRGRVYQHKTGAFTGFTARYRVNRLVYFEVHADVRAAILREKQLKGWIRKRKVELIEAENPEWDDLSEKIGLPASSAAGGGR